MRIPRPRTAEPVTLWFGVFGAPAAWTTQHVTGIALSEAACNVAYRGEVAFDALTLAVMTVAAVVALLAEMSAIAAYRRSRDTGDEPPGSRIHFLAIVGVAIGPLFLAMILMSGLGAAVLENCRQS